MSLCAGVIAPSGACAQDVRVGGAAVVLSSTFDGPPFIDFEPRRGFGAEVFADVVTPLAPLEVRVAARFVRRGAELADRGGAEIDWLAFPLAMAPRIGRGPVSAMALAGVEVAYPIATRQSPDIENGYSEVARTEVAGVFGIELAVDLPARWRIGVESRWHRALTATLEGTEGQLRTRAHEWSLRLSRLR